MNIGAVLTWVITLGALTSAVRFILRNARVFAASPLAGPKMRQVTGLYVPLLAGVFGLSLAGIALAARGEGAESALDGGAPLLLMLLSVALPVVMAVTVAVQGFTLSERFKRGGDAEAAGRLASRGFFVLLVGGASVLVTIFAAGLLTGFI